MSRIPIEGTSWIIQHSEREGGGGGDGETGEHISEDGLWTPVLHRLGFQRDSLELSDLFAYKLRLIHSSKWDMVIKNLGFCRLSG